MDKLPDQYRPEDFITVWEEDGKWDDAALDIESLRIPNLHAKYLRYLSMIRLKSKRLILKRKELLVILREYYLGNLNTTPQMLEQLERPPMLHRHLKQDVLIQIEADSAIQQLDDQLTTINESLAVLEEILRSINNRGFQIKNAIDWRRLTNFTV